MGFKEQLKRSYKGVKGSVSGFTNNIKLEYKKGQLKNELSELYETLGQVRYAEIIDGGDVTDESVKLCNEIARISAEIKALESKNIKDNEFMCTTCNKNLPNEVSYCPYCGTKKEEV